MSNLYSNLAKVYESMYQTFVDYEEEFNLYHRLLVTNNCSSVVEIGCGTGNLAKRFFGNSVDYTGLDISVEMLTIANQNCPDCNIINTSMQQFVLPSPKDAAIISGRTISYLLTNNDITDSFAAIHNNLTEPGILCFDFIDASKFIPLVSDKPVIHKASVGNQNFYRESFWKLNLGHGWTFDWRSVFYEVFPNGKQQMIGEDNSTIRTFTKDEIILFLQLAGFRVKDIRPRKTYAFDTFLVVAEKYTVE